MAKHDSKRHSKRDVKKPKKAKAAAPAAGADTNRPVINGKKVI